MNKDIIVFIEEIERQSRFVWDSGLDGEFNQFHGDLDDTKKYYWINYPVNGREFIKLNENELFNAVNKIIQLSLNKDTIKTTQQLLELISNSTQYFEAYNARSYEDGYNEALHIAFVAKSKLYELVLHWSPD